MVHGRGRRCRWRASPSGQLPCAAAAAVAAAAVLQPPALAAASDWCGLHDNAGNNSACATADAAPIVVPKQLLHALREPAGYTLNEQVLPSPVGGRTLSSAQSSVIRAGESVSGPSRPGLDERVLLPLSRDFFVKLGGDQKTVIVSWTTGDTKGNRVWIAVNLALSIRKNTPHLEKQFAFISLDVDAHELMQEYGFNTALCAANACRSNDLKDDIWKMRWYLMNTLTGFGLWALVVDADIVFLGDPLKVLRFDSDMEVMTDHFFPERHLYEPWVRVEDHINTGFVLVRPTAPLRKLVSDFVSAHWDIRQGLVRRDAMDQRVFNHFVLRRMSADIPEVYVAYDNLTFGRKQQIVPGAPYRQACIRILNPAVIAHGMNYFWRRAHLLHGDGSLPAVAHVNGADPKEYFLRDRQVWFVDDWDRRFADDEQFLTYEHPQGMSLQQDFQHLSAAIEVARLLRRRVVLPATMNCRNSPAYRVWNLDQTIQRESEHGNCTFDYFAWAKVLLEAHERHVVESAVRHHETFQYLLETSSAKLPMSSSWPTSGIPSDAASLLAPGSPSVLAAEEDITLVRSALRSMLQHAEWQSFRCAFQQFPHQVNVCRDERYVARFGESAKCDPYPEQAACGFDGFTCCMSFWGFSEKLEIFTGARWDLPCNCGLGESCIKTRDYAVEREEQQYDRLCCAHMWQTSQEHCTLVPQQQNITIYGDSHFYSSYLMSDFLEKRIDPLRAFEKCQQHRRGTLLDSDPDRARLHCNYLFGSLALWHGRYDRAFRWWEYMHWERRRPRAGAVLSPDTGESDTEVFDDWKARHDVRQLKHLLKQPPKMTVTPYAPQASAELLRQLVGAYERLLALSDEAGRLGNEEARQRLRQDFNVLQPYYNRAINVPHVERMEASALNTKAHWASCTKSFLRDGLAHLSSALSLEALKALQKYFLDATIWYGSRYGGTHLKAQLADGLHAELLFQVAAELREQLPDILASHQLTDIIAYKYETDWPGNPGLGVHTLNAAVAVSLWTTPKAASLDSSSNGFEVYDATAPLDMNATERYTWTLRLGDHPMKYNALKATGFRSHKIPYQQNRLVVWNGSRFFQTDWSPRSWRSGYKHQRIDLWFLFGRTERARGVDEF